MILALFGLACLCYNFIQNRVARIEKGILILTVYAVVVSIISIVSMVVNHTPDSSYASYVVSMWVWFSAAYAVCFLIKIVHGQINIGIISNYLIAVCVFQCLIALVMDSFPIVKLSINQYVIQGQDFLDQANVRRLYGIGANLDTAGIRFSLVLVLLIHSLLKAKSLESRRIALLVVSYVIIIVIGNMISRTTIVGAVISFLYLIIGTITLKAKMPILYRYIWKVLLLVLMISVPYIIWRYNASIDFAKKMQFAFEGFFSIAETGDWQVGSNDQLKRMIILPTNLNTWIIGDGYFMNPKDVDPFYVGPLTGGYYMGTDVGYLRFIFYFGVLGLFTFAIFIAKAAHICIELWGDDKWLFIIFTIINYIVWIKVATDCFLIFALFIAAVCVGDSYDEERDYENNI